MTITLDVSGMAAEELQGIRSRLADSSATHSAMAGKAELFIKKFGADASSRRHTTANRLGAAPTNHLAKAYQAIEGQSDAESARLLVPRASRLRAAFGAYTARPTGGRKYLTIPYTAEAYGKRAGEMGALEFGIELVSLPNGYNGYMRVLKKKDVTPVEVVYTLIQKANFAEDRTLIPFEDLTSQSADAAELFILTGEIQS